MVYKAIKEIGGYGIGDEVPDDKAKLWLSMYLEPQVELVDGESMKEPEEVEERSPEEVKQGQEEAKKAEEEIAKEEETEEESEEEEPEEKSDSNNPMINDYLARNTSVVKKNIKSDKLGKDRLEQLLESEESGKNRNSIILTIKEKLKRYD